MATIDVSRVLRNPRFQSAITLITRTADVSAAGRGSLTESETDIQAVVQPASPQDIQKLPEGARQSEAITVWAALQLLAMRSGGYSDVVIWNSQRYEVKSAEPWMNYGSGYTKAIATKQGIGNG